MLYPEYFTAEETYVFPYHKSRHTNQYVRHGQVDLVMPIRYVGTLKRLKRGPLADWDFVDNTEMIRGAKHVGFVYENREVIELSPQSYNACIEAGALTCEFEKAEQVMDLLSLRYG
jgi:hypothetical protein